MARVREKTSAGGVVFRREGDGIHILLLRKKREGADTWELPKGGVKEGEELGEAALREVCEETGIAPAPVLVAPLGSSIHTFRRKGMLVAKTTHYFLFESVEDATLLPRREEGFVEARWLPVEEAARTVSYDNLRPIIRSCMEHI